MDYLLRLTSSNIVIGSTFRLMGNFELGLGKNFPVLSILVGVADAEVLCKSSTPSIKEVAWQ